MIGISGHKTKVLVGLFILVLLQNINYFKDADDEYHEEPSEAHVGHGVIGDSKSSHAFWHEIFTLFKDNGIPMEDDKNPWIKYKYDTRNFGKTRIALLDRADISEEHFNMIKNKHTKVVEGLPDTLPTSVYNSGKKGIVMTGGGFFSWLSYLSILQLRDLGSKLPIEIVLPEFSDYKKEKDFCDKILPKYNARCIIIPEELGLTEEHTDWEFKKFQYKGLALSLTSFQHVLMLDSDNFPVANPDSFFDAPVYKDHGMVLWPDYWKRSMSPRYYEIAGQEINYNKRVRSSAYDFITPQKLYSHEMDKVDLHDLEGTVPDLSTESGQLLINKETHGKALLLSLYYNTYGPQVYYKLFALGARGEGDKDTFAAAAVVTKSKFYQVKSYIHPFFFYNGDTYKGTAMGQHNPELDYKLFTKQYSILSKDKKNQIMDSEEQVQLLKKFDEEFFYKTDKVPMFTVHCNIYKIDPAMYMSRSGYLYNSKFKRLEQWLKLDESKAPYEKKKGE
ncbi:mannosyltransferase putative-domain-containing protein [Scheffersomyces xylosifermentans]|uniref:mannosyltransferase putative-domain-containing protein n=1 Tax=Scheffersomyces xylosifermentans TaxID=1304137 RepID=UPI00315D2DED